MRFTSSTSSSFIMSSATSFILSRSSFVRFGLSSDSAIFWSFLRSSSRFLSILSSSLTHDADADLDLDAAVKADLVEETLMRKWEMIGADDDSVEFSEENCNFVTSEDDLIFFCLFVFCFAS